MIRTMIVVYCIVLFFLIPLTLVSTASECTYGSVHAWFRSSDGEWENATAHPLLKRGEAFEIKIVVTAKTNLQVFFLKLHEFGTPVFEVLSGSTIMEQLLECRQNILPGQTFTYAWEMQIRSDTTWVNGYAPLEVFTQFYKNDTAEHRMSFDVITAFIVDELWEQYVQENISENLSSQHTQSNTLSGFEFEEIIIAVFLLSIVVRLREQMQ
jgi:sarcinarray family protein